MTWSRPRVARARHVHDSLADTTTYALTGSQGKTGTKDYPAAILEGDGPTIATRGNFNNEIGVPLTVLRAGRETMHLVVEMGARGVGHIAHLCRIAPPDVAAVVNVGTAHIGEFGSREAIAEAKGEIVEALTADGTAVLNATDPLVAAMAPRTIGTVVDFGDGGAVSATEVFTDDLGRPSFDLQWRGAARPCTSPSSGCTRSRTPSRRPRWRSPGASTSMPSPTG
ncbi:Mur ligase family protein [Nocardioides sp. B-3]|uniref:Mur ligase family protein n=1 Tax=Nocardioides sp. B-3 TaxID=2895565 RepID=UPI00215292C6|nr:Mur ligase family protein [Nocardioides sp. B-3]UUZ61849.1 hypothetical protein LP418_00345 [Nocardioides sp. B-3]